MSVLLYSHLCNINFDSCYLIFFNFLFQPHLNPQFSYLKSELMSSFEVVFFTTSRQMLGYYSHYTIEAMKCLTKYALHLSFLDPAFDVSLWLVRDHLTRIKAIIDGETIISKWFNLSYNVDKSWDAQH